jgi:hypothetical protein
MKTFYGRKTQIQPVQRLPQHRQYPRQTARALERALEQQQPRS